VASREDIEPIRWANDHLELLDQTMLPERQEYVHIHDAVGAVTAIRTMQVRGAPAIGVTAAYAMALAARGTNALTMAAFLDEIAPLAVKLATVRPTALNLGWAVQTCMDTARAAKSPTEAREKLLELAHRIREEDIATNKAIGGHGAPLIPNDGGVLTHCNTGALATAGFGTALGVIRAAWEQGKRPTVFCTETRPWLQGARLTAWELVQMGIPASLIVDSAAGSLMSKGKISAIVVGADRIAANGDVANKIGTYSLAVLANEHTLPFYVAAPLTSVDLGSASGEDIVVEERPPEEVTHVAGRLIAAKGIDVWNPSFDVTPSRYISAIITERGLVRAPYDTALRSLAFEATNASAGGPKAV
jgi:methylthioribose-1-phosphate isomerase